MTTNSRPLEWSPCFTALEGGAEILILDPRANARPSQMVEEKLVALLRSDAVPMSALRTAAHSLATGFRGRLRNQSDRCPVTRAQQTKLFQAVSVRRERVRLSVRPPWSSRVRACFRPALFARSRRRARRVGPHTSSPHHPGESPLRSCFGQRGFFAPCLAQPLRDKRPVLPIIGILRGQASRESAGLSRTV